MIKKILVIAICSLVSLFALSADTGSYRDITSIRVTTSDNVTAIQQEIMLVQLSGDLLLHNCSYVGIGSDNEYAASTVLMAHAASKPIRVWYDYDQAKYGPGVCHATTISVN